MKGVATDVVGFEDHQLNELHGDISKKSKSCKKNGGFQAMGLSSVILKGLKKRGYKQPTPIQRKSIPLILEGRDVVAMARTGSGKTACFLVPLFEKMLKPRVTKSGGIRSLILSPTRELAIQTLRFIRELGKFTRLKSIVVLGGDSMDQQFGALHTDPDIVVATPGRFLHVCVEMDMKLSSVEYIVFDEADRLFEMGFGEQMQEILNRLPDSRQTVLFSATLPKLLVNFARAGLSDPALIRLDVESKLPDTLDLAFMAVRSEDKPAALLCMLQTLPENRQTLVFLATKHHVEYCHMILDRAGISNTFIYSDLDPSARKINAAKFQNGNVSVMLVTDVAARGVDIPQLDYVINYHFPPKAKLFVHRVGRCARAGRTGTAFSLVCAEECPFVLDLHLFLGRPINLLAAGTKPENVACGFGKIPESVIEAEQSRVMVWHETVAELASMQKVCSNGYKKYLRSRPGASAESVKRMRDIDLGKIAVHPFFAALDGEETYARELLDQMKNYKPRGTIFELNVSAKSKGYGIMKTTKKAHEKHIEAFKQKKAVKEEVTTAERAQTSDGCAVLPLGDEKDIEKTFSTVIMGKRKLMSSWVDAVQKKRKKKDHVDRENYIPHSAPDRHTEDGLSLNTFSSDANNVAFDLTEDTEKRLTAATKLMKWDRKKKKMVGVQNEKAGKIRTESGAWISKSFKTNRYAEWKEKSKVAENADSNDEEEAKPVRRQRKDILNTHWAKHNFKVAAKQKSRIGLRRPEQILKDRKVLAKKRQKSLPKKHRFGGGKKKK